MQNDIIDIKDHGFRPDVIIEEEHYELGGFSDIFRIFGDKVIMPGGHGWGAYLPENERQKKYGLETMNCTNYGTHACFETLAKFHGFDDFPEDCSERYLGVLSGTSKTGNSPHKVAEVLRTTAGVIPERSLPFTSSIDTWEKYYAPNPMDESLVAMGHEMLARFRFGHEWVFKSSDSLATKQRKLMEALEKGTVAVSVLAWKQRRLENGDDGLFYKEHDDPDTHWVQLVDYVEGEYWIVKDQYSPFDKHLEWDYNFLQSKVYYLDRITSDPAPEPDPEPEPEPDPEPQPDPEPVDPTPEPENPATTTPELPDDQNPQPEPERPREGFLVRLVRFLLSLIGIRV